VGAALQPGDEVEELLARLRREFVDRMMAETLPRGDDQGHCGGMVDLLIRRLLP